MLSPRLARAAVAAVALAVLAACSVGAGDPDASPSPSATPARVPLTFEQATAALTEALVPPTSVVRCDETSETTVESPTLPQCGYPLLGDLRAASLAGHAVAMGDPVELPVPGGASRVVEVYEMRDAGTAQTAVATEAADLEGWAVDQDRARVDNPDGTFVPRTVVSAAGVRQVDLPGWTAWSLSRDESSFHDDGSAAADPYSAALLWAARDGIVIRVQVVGDAPGQAAVTALDTATRYAGGLSAD